ncbi:MAG: hypothetical protein A2V66_05465 [Ignavibacteria bacterium RBG_13_36_8]|nr:MAG: hypothetical protein A2V66_05465 [Ignavibacteria bacterium RBG_13_36_8]
MKAMYIEKYGGVNEFNFGNMPDPVIRKNEVLVEVHATSVNPVDYKVRNGSVKILSGVKFPKILGTDFSGIVVKVGKGVSKFKVGDSVFGASSVLFGKNGANAEFVAATEKYLAKKPKKLSFPKAAAIPVAGTTVYHNLKNLNIQKRDKVLVNGASGGVGMFALQIAKLFGANVTGVCSAKNIRFVKSLGADYVIDYKKKDFRKNGIKYRIIFDAAGKLRFNDVKNSLTDNGVMLTTLPAPGIIYHFVKSKIFGGKKVIMANANYAEENLGTLAGLIVRKKIKVHIEKTYLLKKAAKAYVLLEKGGVKGKLVVKLK